MSNNNYNKNRRGKKPTSSRPGNRSKDKFERDEKFTKTSGKLKDAINDIAWYAHNPQMLKDSSSVAFSQMLGLPMYFGKFDADSDAEISDKFPGLFVLRTVPSYGSSTTGLTVNPNSAINIAAQNVYSYVRHANSGHSNYDPADLMMYIVAMDQAYAFHSELVRAYGLCRFFSGFNRYLGKYLVDALGFDFDNLVPQLAGFRYLINSFAAKLSTFAVPAIFPIVERHRWLCSNVYMDRPSTRAQLYAFVPEYRGIYNEPVDAGDVHYKAGVKTRVNTPYKKTLADISDMINEVVSPLLHSEDIGIMSGDILKAYGAEKCYMINALPEEYVIGPVYVEEVLKQIHNAITVGTPSFPVQNETSMLVYQEGNSPVVRTWDHSTNIILTPNSTSLVGKGVKNTIISTVPKILDTNVDSPTPEDVMIMSRLTNIPRAVTSDSGTVTSTSFVAGLTSTVSSNVLQQDVVFTSISADAVINFMVYNGELDEDGYPIFTRMWTLAIMQDNSTGTAATIKAYREALADIAKFNWHPVLYEYGIAVASSTKDVIDASEVSLRITADIDNCVLVNRDVINRMHDVALLSMLNVPSAVLTRGV